VLDFENGELTPDELPKLFPGLRIVTTNTYDHTSTKPRFRVIIPTTENMTPEVYGLIYGCIAEKLEDAGYSVERGSKRQKTSRPRSTNSRPSGLDWSQSLPTSLFYLPCQAKQAGDSFFIDYVESLRCLLRPSTWLENIRVPLQPEFEDIEPEAYQRGIDEELVQRAKDVWRTSTGQPGRGDEMFFNLALSLKRAGMNLGQIEMTLRAEAKFGRSPKERAAQIRSIMVSLGRYSVSAS